MAIENTVSSVFLSAFVDCKERFRLPPIRCGSVVQGSGGNMSSMALLLMCFDGRGVLDVRYPLKITTENIAAQK